MQIYGKVTAANRAAADLFLALLGTSRREFWVQRMHELVSE